MLKININIFSFNINLTKFSENFVSLSWLLAAFTPQINPK